MFNMAATNKPVYDTVVWDLIAHRRRGRLVQRHPLHLRPYGQTSSGKTFTTNGSDSDPGVTPRAVRDVFNTVRQVGSSFEGIPFDHG